MKTKYSIFFILSLTLLSYRCTDPCDGIDCNNGSCDEGTCICDEGFEGENCDIRRSAIFTGEWSGNFDCGEINKDAIINIEDDPVLVYKLIMDSDGIEFSFNGLSFSLDNTVLNATINEQFTGFSIDTQLMTIEIPNNPGISANVFGSGTLINQDKMNVEINVKNDDFGAVFNCSASLSK